MVERVTFLIDGFNVYHSILEALKSTKVQHAKWVDYHAFCKSFLLDVANFSRNTTIAKVRYFTALVKHAPNPDVVTRHNTFISALESVDVEVIHGNFKEKQLKCKSTCGQVFKTHEEKETDVNIAIHLLKAFMTDECDTAVIISGDTDLIPAVTMAKSLFPSKRVAVAFPYRRSNNHFKQVADFTFKIYPERYEKHQLPNPCQLKNGSTAVKPATW